MRKIITIITLACFANSIFAQVLTCNQGKIEQKHYFQEIPYQEIIGLMVVPVTINGKIYNFIFDTGATLAISDKIFKELNLKIIKQVNAIDASGESGKARLILLPEIELQGITFLNTPGAVFPENELTELAECLGIDGIIGSNMLRNSVVQFDEQKKQIIITNDVKRVLPQDSNPQKMKLSPWTSNPYIKITLQKGANRVAHHILFDSGDAGGLLTLSLSELNGCIVDTLAESEGSFEAGALGVFKNQKHLLLHTPELVVNDVIFNDVIIPTTNANSSRIGVKILQYGKTTLDYKRKRFYFEPFGNVNTSKPIEKPWAIAPSFQNGKTVVGIIWDKQLESQINLGDEILSINGIDVQALNFCEFVMLNNSRENDKIIFEIKDVNTGEIKKIEIEQLQ